MAVKSLLFGRGPIAFGEFADDDQKNRPRVQVAVTHLALMRAGLWSVPEKDRYAGQTERPGTRCNRSLSHSTSEDLLKKKKKATRSLSYLLSWGAICPKDAEQLERCNRLIPYRWDFIKRVRYVERVVPTRDQRWEKDGRFHVHLLGEDAAGLSSSDTCSAETGCFPCTTAHPRR